MKKALLPAFALAAALAATGLPAPVHAQNAQNLGGVGSSHTMTVRAKVRSVNHATREVTLVGPEGNVFTVHAGDEVKNLDQVKKGDTVVAKYTQSTVVVLAGPGEPVPQDTLTVAGTRSAPGQTPSAAASARAVITASVVGIDLQNHTLQVVNPSGGRVRTVEVADPRLQDKMSRVSIGDRITLVLTDAIAISLEPAH